MYVLLPRDLYSHDSTLHFSSNDELIKKGQHHSKINYQVSCKSKKNDEKENCKMYDTATNIVKLIHGNLIATCNFTN